MEETIPPLSLALRSGLDSQKRSFVLDCIALVTFVGAIDADETENAMKIIWETIHPRSGSKVGPVTKLLSVVLAASIPVWSFLLITMNGWGNCPDNWQESVHFLSTLLERNVVLFAAAVSLLLPLTCCCHGEKVAAAFAVQLGFLLLLLEAVILLLCCVAAAKENEEEKKDAMMKINCFS